MLKGILRFFKTGAGENMGHGFIDPEDGSQEVFFTGKTAGSSGLKNADLIERAFVEFEAIEGMGSRPRVATSLKILPPSP